MQKSESAGGPLVTPVPDTVDRALVAFRGLIHTLRARIPPPWLDVDLTMPQAKAFLAICAAGAIHGRALAQALGVGHPAVSKLVDQLVERGYVRRADDQNDRRITWLSSTDEGQALYDRLTVARRETLRSIVEALEPDEAEVVIEAWNVLSRAALRQPATVSKESETT